MEKEKLSKINSLCNNIGTLINNTYTTDDDISYKEIILALTIVGMNIYVHGSEQDAVSYEDYLKFEKENFETLRDE